MCAVPQLRLCSVVYVFDWLEDSLSSVGDLLWYNLYDLFLTVLWSDVMWRVASTIFALLWPLTTKVLNCNLAKDSNKVSLQAVSCTASSLWGRGSHIFADGSQGHGISGCAVMEYQGICLTAFKMYFSFIKNNIVYALFTLPPSHAFLKAIDCFLVCGSRGKDFHVWVGAREKGSRDSDKCKGILKAAFWLSCLLLYLGLVGKHEGIKIIYRYSISRWLVVVTWCQELWC